MSQALEDGKKCNSFARQSGGGPGDAGESCRAAGRLCVVRGPVPGSSPAGTGSGGYGVNTGAGRGPHPDKGGPRAAASARCPLVASRSPAARGRPFVFLRQLQPRLAEDSGRGAPRTTMPGRCMGARTESRRCGSLATRPWLAQPAHSLSSPLCEMGTRSHPTHGLVGGLVVLQMLAEVFLPLAPPLPLPHLNIS